MTAPGKGDRNVEIQKAQLADIDALVELRIAYLTEDHGHLEAGAAERIAEMLPGYFRAHLGRDLNVYIVREGEDIVSCAFLLLVEKPMSPSYINGKTECLYTACAPEERICGPPHKRTPVRCPGDGAVQRGAESHGRGVPRLQGSGLR